MELSDILNDLFIFCSKKDISFRYISSDSEINKIEVNKQNRELVVTIIDPEDKNFLRELGDIKTMLEQLFH